MSNGVIIRRSFAFAFVAAVLVSSYWIYQNKEKILIPELRFKSLTREFNGHAKLKITSNIGDHGILRMKVSIPCADIKQFETIMQRMPRVESDFLLSVDQNEIKSLIDNKDFKTLKVRILKIVNRHVPWEVKDIYFDTLLFK